MQKTSYKSLETGAEDALEAMPALGVIEAVDAVRRADTSIVDDLATLLAMLQAKAAPLEEGRFAPSFIADVGPNLLHAGRGRLSFMLAIAISAKLIEAQGDKAQPRRDEARAWLEAERAQQIRRLATAWLESPNYPDLWHVPGLKPEDSGWNYNAVAARSALMNLLADLLPEKGWVSINDLIEIIKEFEPDFQRPNGDYDSWYIRNEAGEFLTGFESWDAVEGALIEFYLTGPMHWLGLADIGDDVARLTAYGRAFLQFSDWPQPDEPDTRINIRNDGALLVSRRVNRFERFQLARFARCIEADDSYVYRIDADSIQRAAAQNIQTKQIQSFVARHLQGEPLPPPIANLLRNWEAGAQTSVSMEPMIVLRTTSEETLEKIVAAPAFRRYIGARLGPLACAVRPDQWEALRAALMESAIEVDISRLQTDAD